MKKWTPIHILAVFLSFLCATGAQGQTTSQLSAASVLAMGVAPPSVGSAGAVESLLDCNNNGIDDADDIANLTSPDCNTNGIPDECEIDENGTAPGGPFFCTFDCDPDCNRTGVPDECELNDNDCNFDGVPDECGVLIDCGLAHESHRLIASDGARGDLFGGSVSISGDTAIVGAEHGTPATYWSGSAYIRQRDYGGLDNWGEVTKLIASDAAGGNWFGASVSISGDTAIVGAWANDNAAESAGSAYIFQRDHGGPNNWGEVAQLNASGAVPYDLFGYSVSISGDTAIVGDAFSDGDGSGSGSAYIFQRDHGGPDNWGEFVELTPSDGEAYDDFGGSVSISGDTAIVGAYGNRDAGYFTGSAYIFQRDQGGPNNWGEVVKLTASDAAATNFFGGSVSISGDAAIVGADRNQNAGLKTGSAYIFLRDYGGPDNWGEVAKLIAPDAAEDDLFGDSVSISGDTAVIGARGRDDAGDFSGTAYIFQRDYGGLDNWGQFAELTASDADPDDGFGSSVSIDDDTVIVGAYHDDEPGRDHGSAYVFNLPPVSPDCNCNGTPDRCELAYTDCDANAVPDECDIADGALDCQSNGILDVCETDCDANGVPDDCDIADGASDCQPNGILDVCETDCDANGVPDDCDIAGGAPDCQSNGILDTCETDCNANDVPDECDVDPTDPDGNGEVSGDCNASGIPDECDGGCNANSIPDECDVDPTDPDGNGEVSGDCNVNGLPDECEGGCNANSVPDECDIDPTDPDENGEVSQDCDENSVPDECQPDCDADGTPDVCELPPIGSSEDCDENSVPDECQPDCDADGMPDACELAPIGASEDCNYNAVPDECEPDEDCNENSIRDICDIGDCPSGDHACADCDGNSVPDACDIAGGVDDCQPNGILDVCELPARDCNDNGIPDDCEPGPVDCEFLPPGLPDDEIHRVAKHRYISVDATTNLPYEVAIKVQIVQMMRCEGDLRRSCLRDEDCPTVCDNDPDIHSCVDGGACGGGSCVVTAPCVDHPDVGLSWFVQEPQMRQDCPNDQCDDDDWFARVDRTAYSDDWAAYSTLHIGDCEIVPCITYEVRACLPPDGVRCSLEALTVATQQMPWGQPRHFGDTVGPLSPDHEFGPPDGFVNVMDVWSFLLTQRHWGTSNKPQTHPTWIDIYGRGDGLPPDYIINVSDLDMLVWAVRYRIPWESRMGTLSPGDCP